MEHSLKDIYFVIPFFFLPSHLHRSSLFLHQNTGPKWLTPSFSICIRDVIQVKLCLQSKMMHKYTTLPELQKVGKHWLGESQPRAEMFQFITSLCIKSTIKLSWEKTMHQNASLNLHDKLYFLTQNNYCRY